MTNKTQEVSPSLIFPHTGSAHASDKHTRYFPMPNTSDSALLSDILSLFRNGLMPDRTGLARIIDAASAPGEAGATLRAALFDAARERAQSVFGKRIYIRGLIEFTSFCRNDCLYCGLRRSNRHAARYRLATEDILACCARGHDLGFRTFVLQGGEDAFFTDDRIVELICAIKSRWPDSALTLSIGERSAESYRRFREAGADRYLLRHESANPAHYARLHPPAQTFAERRRCLYALKEADFQTGAGMMVGTPWQTTGDLVEDLCFLHELQPEMVGIGPFIPHHDTPFAQAPAGSVEQTLVMLALTRLMLPRTLLPATTALGTAADDGRERGILTGANVIMPNLSPPDSRKKYMLYDNKRSDGDEAAENLRSIEKRIAATGYEIAIDRGDWK